MLLTILRRPVRLGVLLLVAACGDFTLVEPQSGEGTFLGINITAVSNETTAYELQAFFFRTPQIDVVDPTLYVEGTPISPDRQRDVWSYRWQGTRTTAGNQADLLRIALPVVSGGSSSPQAITVPVTYRAGPLNIELQRGTDLVLGLSLGNRVTTGLSGHVDFWHLDVQESCVSNTSPPQFTIHGNGAHPSELRVPWQWLETMSSASTSACFRAYSSYDVAGSLYPVRVGVAVQVVWRINVVG